MSTLSSFSRPSLWIALILGAFALPLFSADSVLSDALQGTWTGKRTGDNGTELRQTLEIVGTKMTYTLASMDGDVRLLAKGTVKAEKLGDFLVMKVTGIQAGGSESDLQSVGDDRSTIYQLNDDTLTLASNFEKVRDGQKPSVDVYTLKERPKAPTTGYAALLGKWKAKVKREDEDRDYDMSFAESAGQLTAVLVSPRSGEHKFRTVTFKDGKISMEIVRDIQGNEAVFIYDGELKDGALSGKVVVKGFEDQYKGTWTAKKE